MSDAILKEPFNLLSMTDASRKDANCKLKVETKSELGQYMTPASVALFMASLFPATSEKTIRLLDPGAGVGSLTSAFIEYISDTSIAREFDVDAYEIDPTMRMYLKKNLDFCKSAETEKGNIFSWSIIGDDFIVETSRKIASINGLWAENTKKYTHCIMNPPYKKILSSSLHRRCLRSIGIETVNLYSAFVATSLLLMRDKGFLVAIIPRSFCNGAYYLPFREYLLKHSAIKHIHLFKSRKMAFKDDNVLQENIIIAFEKGGKQGNITVSTSTDDTFSDISSTSHPFHRIVKKDDREMYLHIPMSAEVDFLDDSDVFRFTLHDIGVQVSTGPVVDFRLDEYLREMPGEDTVPLLYPSHFKSQKIQWPVMGGKKPNAIVSNQDTKKWLYPSGFYTIVRRFSSKEEKRRIVAYVVDPSSFENADEIGFENHLNLFHCNRRPLPEILAIGLAVFLNSTAFDENFRRFSGHTQVNATDLRLMKYPSLEMLNELGRWAQRNECATQQMIDEQIIRISK